MPDPRHHRLRRPHRPTHPPMPAPNLENDLTPDPAADLRFIRDTMERSASLHHQHSSADPTSRQVLLTLVTVNHMGHERHTRVTRFACDLPTSFGWKDDVGGHKSRMV
jgi:hypothetical protein